MIFVTVPPFISLLHISHFNSFHSKDMLFLGHFFLTVADFQYQIYKLEKKEVQNNQKEKIRDLEKT